MSQAARPLQARRGVGWQAQARLAVAVGLFALVFGPTWAWAVRIWARSEYYGHSFLIIAISGFLAWRLWRTRPEPGGIAWPGMALLGLGLAVHIWARSLDVWFPSGFAFVICLAGAIWWLGRWTTFRHLWFPVAYLAFAVPMERFLVLKFAQPLQLGASTAAAGVAQAVGMRVAQVGTTINLPNYTFDVAIPCSGLKSSIAMSALGALVAFLVSCPAWSRVVIFACSIPLALLANAVRIVATLVLADTIGPAAAEGFFHKFSGMVVFLIAFAGLLAAARALRCTGMRHDL